jgi:pentatricopeptide repeat protein
MMLDGVKPERDTFHSLIAGTMRGALLQDAFFFRDEMKAMGLVPDVIPFLLSILASLSLFLPFGFHFPGVLYSNCIVSTTEFFLIV